MPLLRDEPELLEAFIQRAAEASGIPIQHVEKDYWLTECLFAMKTYAEENDFIVILKGGTSLSKAYRLIHRFSEDADMLVVFGELSRGRRDAHLKGLIAAVEAQTGIAATSDDAWSDAGETRVVSLPYPTTDAGPVLSPQVKIELHRIGGSFPHSARTISPLILDHWEYHDPVGYLDRRTFEMQVLDPCRTLVEKLVLLHEAHTRDSGQAIDRKVVTVRHYYDVWCLLGDEQILADLHQHGITVLAHDVFTYTEAAGLHGASRPEGGFANSPAFTTTTRQIEAAYQRVIDGLIWDGRPTPTLEECTARVQELAKSL